PRQVSIGGGIWPRWSHDGKKLYYVKFDGTIVAVSLDEKEGELKQGATSELFRPPILINISNRWQYDVDHLDRFLINIPVEDVVASPITLVLNWKPPLA